MSESPSAQQSPTTLKFVKVANSDNFLMQLIYVLCCLQPELAMQKVEVESVQEQAKDPYEVKQGAATNSRTTEDIT